MPNFTNEPPEDLNAFFKQLILYINTGYDKGDRELLKKILQSSTCRINRTGEWGSRWGYAAAKVVFFIHPDKFTLVTNQVKMHLMEITDNLLEGTDCGLEIVKAEFIPNQVPVISVEKELIEIVDTQGNLPTQVPLSHDIIEKGKEMSEAYLYIYFVENYLREFIEHVGKTNTLAFPQEVTKTIAKNKANETQNKFLPLRGNSNLFYCDFVQLQQIIVHNWAIFNGYFPQKDQHWLRVKIEDMYRVRNLIAHCGYVRTEDIQMVKANFKMILTQLKV